MSRLRPSVCRIIFLTSIRWGCFESAIESALAHHLPAVSVERVIDDPLGGILFVVVLETQVAEPLGNRLQPFSLRLAPERVVGIRAVDDLAEQDQGRVTRQSILLENGLKRAFLAVVSQFYRFHVIGNGSLSFSYLHHLVSGDEQELCVLVHKFLD